jgi:hypothetical protein
MGLHQNKKLLHKKRNNYQKEETTYKMREILSSYSLDRRLISECMKNEKH